MSVLSPVQSHDHEGVQKRFIIIIVIVIVLVMINHHHHKS